MAEKYGIRITQNNGTVGWIVGKDCDILLFKTKAEAVKALNQMKNNSDYSWNCKAEAIEFIGFKKHGGNE